MKLNSPVPHKKARIEIIPLIDIMFFLLASFMLVSLSMIRMKGVKVSLPQAMSGAQETKTDFITITVKPTGEILWDKETVPIVAEQLVAKIRPMFEKDNELRIYINADRDATHGTVIDVLDRVRQAGVSKVSFAIRPVPVPVPAAPAKSLP